MRIKEDQLLPVTFVNGVLSDAIASNDRGLAYGDGVFETIRCNNWQPVLWNEHIARLQNGLSRLAIAFDVSVLVEQKSTLFAELKRQNIGGNGILKIVVTRGEGERGYRPMESKPTLILSWHELSTIPAYCVEQGIELAICTLRLGENPTLAGIKHLNRLEQVLAAQEFANTSVDDGVLLSSQGNVVETTNKNIFFVDDGVLLTPELTHAGVQGVMRDFIIQIIAPALNIKVVEQTLSESYLEQMAEAFVCNSVSGVWPIRQIAGRSLAIGETTRRIQQYVAGVVND